MQCVGVTRVQCVGVTTVQCVGVTTVQCVGVNTVYVFAIVWETDLSDVCRSILGKGTNQMREQAIYSRTTVTMVTTKTTTVAMVTIAMETASKGHLNIILLRAYTHPQLIHVLCVCVCVWVWVCED